MQLSHEQLSSYREQGFLMLPELFSAQEVAVMRAELPELFATAHPSRVMEEDGVTVRAVHGSHLTHPLFEALCRQPRLLKPAQQILSSDVYVHQFKINAKAAFTGDVWPWHQDYVFWAREDGMPTPRALNVAIYLEAVNEFNGPLLLIPGSHRDASESAVEGEQGQGWRANVSAKLSYTYGREVISGMVSRSGMVSAKGEVGSVLLFDPLIAHCSQPNLSPFDRPLIIVSYNSVENVPKGKANPRPAFLAAQDATPLQAATDGALVNAL